MVYDDDEGKYWIQCDECGKEYGPFDTFREAVDYGKDNDWYFAKENGEWINKCPDCS